MNLKYIVLKQHDGTELPFMFSAEIAHADFLAGAREIPMGYYLTGGRNWRRELGDAKCVAGGFFNGKECHGESTSIGVKSRGAVDTVLLAGVQP